MSKQYQNLMSQLDRLHRHNRQGSYRTRARYFQAMPRLCRFLANLYRLNRPAKSAPKHLVAYAAFLQDAGKAPSTIKTDLAAIRFYHDRMDHPRYELPGNELLALPRRSFLGVDRTWSPAEFSRMLSYALELGREDIITVLHLGRYMALRIHECYRLDTAAAASALREDALTVKGKGGLVRTVPLPPILVPRLQRHLAEIPRGHKLFVPDGVPTHQAIQELQAFIRVHRAFAQDPDSTRPMTFHGLRHTCAAQWYRESIQAGRTPYEARLAVSRLLGHGRDDVTKIYLASLSSGQDSYKDDLSLRDDAGYDG